MSLTWAIYGILERERENNLIGFDTRIILLQAAQIWWCKINFLHGPNHTI